jgi:hypothetical protein
MSATGKSIEPFKAKLKALMDKAEATCKAEIATLAETHLGKAHLSKSQLAAYEAMIKQDFVTAEHALVSEFLTKLKSKVKH